MEQNVKVNGIRQSNSVYINKIWYNVKCEHLTNTNGVKHEFHSHVNTVLKDIQDEKENE